MSVSVGGVSVPWQLIEELPKFPKTLLFPVQFIEE
jgi:hypothetical protein